MLPALPNVAILRFSGLSILPRVRGILWGLLGQAAARGGVSMLGPRPRGGLCVSPPLRRLGMAAPSDRNRTLQRSQGAGAWGRGQPGNQDGPVSPGYALHASLGGGIVKPPSATPRFHRQSAAGHGPRRQGAGLICTREGSSFPFPSRRGGGNYAMKLGNLLRPGRFQPGTALGRVSGALIHS